MKQNNYKPQIPDVMEAIFDAAYLIFALYKEYHEETTEEIEEDILCNTKKIQSTSYFQ